MQEIAGGRFTFGVGFGWLAEEFAALDVPFDERVTRFEETIEVLRAAWGGGEVRHEGRHFSISGVQVTNRATEIPLILGGNTERALRRAPGSATGGSPPARRRSRSRSGCATSCSGCAPRATGPTTVRPGLPHRGADPAPFAATPTTASTRCSIWTDQVWPVDQPLAAKRNALFAAASALGVQ